MIIPTVKLSFMQRKELTPHASTDFDAVLTVARLNDHDPSVFIVTSKSLGATFKQSWSCVSPSFGLVYEKWSRLGLLQYCLMAVWSRVMRTYTAVAC